MSKSNLSCWEICTCFYLFNWRGACVICFYQKYMEIIVCVVHISRSIMHLHYIYLSWSFQCLCFFHHHVKDIGFGNKSCIMQIHRYIERQQINTKAILQTLDLHITEKRWKASMDIIMLSKAFYEQRGIKLYILFLWRVQTWYSDLSEGREKMMSVIMQVLSHYNI